MSELFHAPAQLTKSELEQLLETVLDGVRSGDTLEGFVEFTIADAPEAVGQYGGWDVRARFRTGNLLGQGGYAMVGEFVPRREETT